MKLQPKALRKTLLFHNVVLSELKNKYKQAGVKNKQIVARILAGRILKKYHFLKEAQCQVGFAYKIMHSNKNRPAGFQFYRREYKNKMVTDTKEQLKKFLEQDDNS